MLLKSTNSTFFGFLNSLASSLSFAVDNFSGSYILSQRTPCNPGVRFMLSSLFHLNRHYCSLNFRSPHISPKATLHTSTYKPDETWSSFKGSIQIVFFLRVTWHLPKKVDLNIDHQNTGILVIGTSSQIPVMFGSPHMGSMFLKRWP